MLVELRLVQLGDHASCTETVQLVTVLVELRLVHLGDCAS